MERFRTYTAQAVEKTRLNAQLGNMENAALDYVLCVFANSRQADFRVILADAQRFFGLKGDGHTKAIDRAFASLFNKLPGAGYYHAHAVHLSAPFCVDLRTHRAEYAPIILPRTNSARFPQCSALVRYVWKACTGKVRRHTQALSERKLFDEYLKPYGNTRQALWSILEKAGFQVSDKTRNRQDDFTTFRATLPPATGTAFEPVFKPLSRPKNPEPPEAPKPDLKALPLDEKMRRILKVVKKRGGISILQNDNFSAAVERQLGLDATWKAAFVQWFEKEEARRLAAHERNERAGLPPPPFGVEEDAERGLWYATFDGKRLNNATPPQYTRAGFKDMGSAIRFAHVAHGWHAAGMPLKFICP